VKTLEINILLGIITSFIGIYDIKSSCRERGIIMGEIGSSVSDERSTHQRRLLILEALHKLKTSIPYEELYKTCKKNKCVKDFRSIETDILHLIKHKFPIFHDKTNNRVQWFDNNIGVCFKDSIVGKNLNKNPFHKIQLARKTLELLLKKGFNSLLLGTGSTVYFFVRELIEQFDSQIDRNITLFTNNILILCDIINSKKDLLINVFVNQGSITRTSCSISNNSGIEALCLNPVNATVVSFNEIRYESAQKRLVFTSAREGDEVEKKMYLAAKQSPIVYIPINIHGVGNIGGIEVATHNDLNPNCNYVIITNPPEPGEQQVHLEDLENGIKSLNLSNVQVILTEPAQTAEGN
jgi:hypothetical protein